MTVNEGTGATSGITFRQLQIFVATAEEGSITGAAEKLFLSQTAISLALRQLEKGLGTTLLIRRRARGVNLTSTGEALLPLGRNILSSVADFSRSAGDGDQLTGSVTVGCFPSLGPNLLPRLMEQFVIENPHASIQFIEAGHNDLVEMLAMGTVDLALTYRMGLPLELLEKTVKVNRLGIMVGGDHPLAELGEPVFLRQLADEPFLMLDSTVAVDHARTVFRQTNVFPQIRFRTSSFETLRSFVGRNLGWSLTLQRPDTVTTHEGRRVKVLEIADEGVPEIPTVVTRSPELTPSRAAQAFLDIIDQVAADLEE